MTVATETAAGFTFAVDEVTPAAEPLKVRPTHEAMRFALDGRLESCCDYHGTVVDGVGYHPLLAAVYTAFNDHRPLVLSPDAVWVTIAQGVAHHMAIHGERLRDRFVAHAGRLTLTIGVDGWVPGSPENPWPDAFAGWADEIRDHVGPPLHDALVCDFTTTGPAERAASQVVLMDVFERYFHYEMIGICGVPAVTLTGTPADWAHLADKAEALRPFDLDWWLAELVPICRQFARAAAGDVDRDHWQAICKLRQAYGGHIINGWVARLFPYVREFVHGPCRRRNPVFEPAHAGDLSVGIRTFDAPSGLSQVPFTWDNNDGHGRRSMEAVGGLLGIAQDPGTLALRPTVGWAVRTADAFAVLLDRLAAEHECRPAAGTPPASAGGSRRTGFDDAELGRLYHRTDGADLFGRGPLAAYRLVPASRVAQLDWSAGGPEADHGMRTWCRLVDLPDGTCLAATMDVNAHQRLEPSQTLPICHTSPDAQGRPAANPVVAMSIAELLARLLDSGGDRSWLKDDRGYGDAEDFTIREATRNSRRRRGRR